MPVQIQKKILYFVVYFTAASMIIFSCLPVFAFAQTTTEQDNSQALQLQQQERAQLEQQLSEIENQIAQYEKELTGIRSEKNTLANKIKQLKVQKTALALQIKQTTLNIKRIESQISDTKSKININNKNVSFLKKEVGVIIQNIYLQDKFSVVQLLATKKNLSDFFNEINNYEKINQDLKMLLDKLNTETTSLKDKEEELSDEQKEQQNLISIINLQNQKLAQNITDQNDLLLATKGKEANYQSALEDTKEKAAEIKNRIYELLGVGKQVTFGEAVKIANWASGETGVRAAFLLAILTQESNLGKNVGTCNRPGDPPEKSWKVIMKPERDQEPFAAITKDLGMDPDVTPVSCPMRDKKGNRVGWGGAMGPAQFIPSTWLGYKDKVTKITGKTANPWDIRDAFIAASIKLKADGAGVKSGEWAAAMKYFSGGTNKKYSFYGDNVVATANQYQKDIDELN